MTDKSTVYDEPSDVDARDGAVEVDGPDGVEVLLTADAANETSERLFDAALKAQGQKVRGRKKD